MNKLAKALGIPSIAIAFVAAIWMIGTTPISEGLPLAQSLHRHFSKPTTMDIALNSKGDIQEIVYGYEWALEKHINKLNGIKRDNKDSPSDLMIELERWKAEQRKIENKLQDWRKKALENRSSIETMIAGA
jgi:hypothetical protein